MPSKPNQCDRWCHGVAYLVFLGGDSIFSLSSPTPSPLSSQLKTNKVSAPRFGEEVTFYRLLRSLRWHLPGESRPSLTSDWFWRGSFTDYVIFSCLPQFLSLFFKHLRHFWTSPMVGFVATTSERDSAFTLPDPIQWNFLHMGNGGGGVDRRDNGEKRRPGIISIRASLTGFLGRPTQ